MWFFMFLPPTKETALLLSTQSALLTLPPASVWRRLLPLGLGLSGLFHAFSAPALANPTSANPPSAGAFSDAHLPRFDRSPAALEEARSGRATIAGQSHPSLLMLCDFQSCLSALDLHNQEPVAAPALVAAEPGTALNSRFDTNAPGYYSGYYSKGSLNNEATAADFGLLYSAADMAFAHLEQPVVISASAADNSDEVISGRTQAKTGKDLIEAQATVDSEIPDLLSEVLAQADIEQSSGEKLDEELGILRVRPLRSRANEELGILRLLQTAQATPPSPPPPPRQPTVFLTGRLGLFDSENAFRSNPRLDEQIYQSGLSLYFFPKLSSNTNLYAIAETNLARYENFDSVNYNELELQLGIRQRLLPRTFAQIGWRNQRLYSPGFGDKLFSVNAIDTLISHRSILNSRMWLDSFYQVRLGFANPDSASRFRQTLTLSLNYGISRSLRTGLLYQLDFDDYTQVSRFDTYQQVLGIVSYGITPESRISVFGGTRFGRSSSPGVSLDDTFYGAGLNVSVPLF